MPPTPKRSVDELKKLQADLRKLARREGLDARIRKELKGPAENAKRKIQSKILSLPSKGQNARKGRESLRRKMYRAVKTNVDTSKDFTGAFVWVDAYEMPTGEENIPAYMEGIKRYTRWRHMVFGNEEKWVTQPRHQYFYRTLKPFESVAADVAENVIGDVKREFEK